MWRYICEAVRQLTPSQPNTLDAGLSKNDLKVALKEMKKGKCPGSDGLPTEFSLCFWEDIEDLVYKSLNHAYDIVKISIEQKRGIVTLIPKKELDELYIKNWGPTTLLNTEYYKLLQKL